MNVPSDLWLFIKNVGQNLKRIFFYGLKYFIIFTYKSIECTIVHLTVVCWCRCLKGTFSSACLVRSSQHTLGLFPVERWWDCTDQYILRTPFSSMSCSLCKLFHTVRKLYSKWLNVQQRIWSQSQRVQWSESRCRGDEHQTLSVGH